LVSESLNTSEVDIIDKNSTLILKDRNEIYITDSSSITFESVPCNGNLLKIMNTDTVLELCKNKKNYNCIFKRIWSIKSFNTLSFVTTLVNCFFIPSHGPIENWLKVNNKIMSEMTEEELYNIWELEKVVCIIEEINKNLWQNEIIFNEDLKAFDLYS